MFNWFRRPLKIVRLLKGKNGRYRWTARIDGQFIAVCRPKGYATLEEARTGAQAAFGGGWEYRPDEGIE